MPPTINCLLTTSTNASSVSHGLQLRRLPPTIIKPAAIGPAAHMFFVKPYGREVLKKFYKKF